MWCVIKKSLLVRFCTPQYALWFKCAFYIAGNSGNGMLASLLNRDGVLCSHLTQHRIHGQVREIIACLEKRKRLRALDPVCARARSLASI